jgi:hypothetical protein
MQLLRVARNFTGKTGGKSRHPSGVAADGTA